MNWVLFLMGLGNFFVLTCISSDIPFYQFQKFSLFQKYDKKWPSVTENKLNYFPTANIHVYLSLMSKKVVPSINVVYLCQPHGYHSLVRMMTKCADWLQSGRPLPCSRIWWQDWKQSLSCSSPLAYSFRVAPDLADCKKMVVFYQFVADLTSSEYSAKSQALARKLMD